MIESLKMEFNNNKGSYTWIYTYHSKHANPLSSYYCYLITAITAVIIITNMINNVNFTCITVNPGQVYPPPPPQDSIKNR